LKSLAARLFLLIAQLEQLHFELGRLLGVFVSIGIVLRGGLGDLAPLILPLLASFSVLTRFLRGAFGGAAIGIGLGHPFRLLFSRELFIRDPLLFGCPLALNFGIRAREIEIIDDEERR